MTTPGEAPRVLNVRKDPLDREPASTDFERPADPWGAGSRVIRTGSLRIALEGLDERLSTLVDAAYRGFVERGGDADRRLVVVRSPEPRYLHLPREGRAEEARVGARSPGEWIELWSYAFAARFDRRARGGRLLLCEAEDLHVGQAIENTLRFLVSAAALDSGGFLLHSAGVARGGRAWLFFGPSGAGKSTTASHAPADGELLGDDLVLVERRARGWHACGVPFRGTFARGDNAAVSAPIAMALRLFQSDENRLEETRRVVQVAELLGEVPFLLDDADMRARASEAIEAFVAAVPVRRLHLRRDGSYWGLIEGE